MAYALSGYLAQSNMAMAKTKCQFHQVIAEDGLRFWGGSSQMRGPDRALVPSK